MKHLVIALSLLLVLSACTSFQCPDNHFEYQENKCCPDENNNRECDFEEKEPEPVKEKVEEKVVVESPEPVENPNKVVRRVLEVPQEVPAAPPIKDEPIAGTDETLGHYLDQISPPKDEYFYSVSENNLFTPYYIIERPGDEFVVIFTERMLKSEETHTVDTVVVNRTTNKAVGTCVQFDSCVIAKSHLKRFTTFDHNDFSEFTIEDALEKMRSVSVRSVADVGLYNGRQVYEVTLVNGAKVTFDRIYNFPLKFENPKGFSVIISDISFTGISQPLLPEYKPLEHKFRKYVAI